MDIQKKSKKRITFILGSMGRGGAERVISILSKSYAQKGWNTDICMLLSNEVGYSLDDSTAVYDFSGHTESRWRRLPYWVKEIRNYTKSKKPDVIISFAARINIITIISLIGLDSKIIVSERNDPKRDGRGILTKILTGVLYPQVFAIVFQTKRVQNMFSNRVRRKSVVIPNPIEVANTAGNPDLDKFVCVGNLKEQKNHKMLINAFSKVCDKYPQKELFIFGEGGLRDEIQSQIDELKLAKNIHLEGNVSNVHEQIKDAYCFILSSDYEGLSNALLEAMVMGLACISTNCAGADEYIENRINGLLVPVGNEEELFKAIITFVEKNDLRDCCGEEAKKVQKRVGLDVTLGQWKEIIE